jgi:hypothetical protein
VVDTRGALQLAPPRSEHYGQCNVVQDEWFVCGTCGHDLPEQWNFVPP